MKFTKVFAAAAIAAAMVGCATNEAPKEEAKATPTPEVTAAAQEEVATEGKYTVTNKTGETVTDLYIYKTGESDKGKNYAEGGLKDGDSVDIEITVDEEVAPEYVDGQTIEYTTESGRTEDGFKTLSLEEANFNLLAEDADGYTSATPFAWAFGE